MKTMEFNLESVSAVGENPLTHSQRWLYFFFLPCFNRKGPGLLSQYIIQSRVLWQHSFFHHQLDSRSCYIFNEIGFHFIPPNAAGVLRSWGRWWTSLWGLCCVPSRGRGGEHVSLSRLYLLETPSWALEREGQLQVQTLSDSERGEEGEMGVSCRSDTEATCCRLCTTQVSPAELTFAPEGGRCSAGLLVAGKQTYRVQIST